MFQLANFDPETGISYGYVSANQLDQELVQELIFGQQATDESFERFLSEKAAELDMEVDELPDDIADDYYCEEPDIMGTLDGVQYLTSWLGGTLHFFILSSPVVARLRQCSPCVPNAHDIRKRDAAYSADQARDLPFSVGYTVPRDWFSEY